MTSVAKPSLISLFTGAGGLDIGLETAGFHTVVAVDNDAACVATLRASKEARVPIPQADGRPYLEGTKIVHVGVEALASNDLRPDGVGQEWVPDLLAGGPPCQPFSSSGKQRGVEDPRGRLFEHFVRLAAELRPKLILFENVRGLVTARGPNGEPGEVLLLVRRAFEEIGYATTFALLNAADYGVPQRRVRCFMMASRCTPLPLFPAPTHAERPTQTLFGPRLPWVTLGEFLAAQPAADEADIVRPSRTLAAQLANLPAGSGLKSPGVRETTRPGGHWGYKQGTFIADLNKPARTVTAASTQDWVRLQDGSLRRLTWRECAALQGFPPQWRFVGSAVSRFRQIGNAVPVAFGQVLGNSLLAALDAAPEAACQPSSVPLPRNFVMAINYTRREEQRNGASRRMVVGHRGVSAGDLVSVKGLDSAG